MVGGVRGKITSVLWAEALAFVLSEKRASSGLSAED